MEAIACQLAQRRGAKSAHNQLRKNSKAKDFKQSGLVFAHEERATYPTSGGGGEQSIVGRAVA